MDFNKLTEFILDWAKSAPAEDDFRINKILEAVDEYEQAYKYAEWEKAVEETVNNDFIEDITFE